MTKSVKWRKTWQFQVHIFIMVNNKNTNFRKNPWTSFLEQAWTKSCLQTDGHTLRSVRCVSFSYKEFLSIRYFKYSQIAVLASNAIQLITVRKKIRLGIRWQLWSGYRTQKKYFVILTTVLTRHIPSYTLYKPIVTG